jgi:opacity protein-like surface antigen
MIRLHSNRVGRNRKMRHSLATSILLAISLLAGPLLAAVPARATDEPDADPAPRSGGFFAMDRADLHDWNLELAGGAMLLDLQGKIGFETDVGDIRFGVGDLDIDRDWSGWAQVQLRFLKKHNLRFMFLPVDFEGNDTVEIGLPLDDPIFVIGDNVDSRAKLYTYQLTYMYDFAIGSWLRISPGLTLGIIDAKIEIRDDTLGIEYDESQPVPLPELGLRVELFPCSRLTLFAEGKGFTIGSKATEWDAGAGLKLHVNRHAFLTASYRAIDYDVDWLDTVIDTRFHGPFFGAGLRF